MNRGNKSRLTIIHSMNSLRKQGCLTILGIMIVIIMAPVVWRNGVKLYYQRNIYAPIEVPSQTTAIVFGAAVYANGRLSAVLVDRVDTAVSLYHAGQVNQIIVSGDNRTEHYDEPGAMMAYAIKQGVAPADVIADRAGHRTYDTCYRALHVFDVRHAVLVTQEFHLPRALLTCEGLGIKAVGAIADKRPYRGANWYEFRETAATTVAAWDVVRRQPPKIIDSVEETIGRWPSTWVGSN
jgi:SanA protein